MTDAHGSTTPGSDSPNTATPSTAAPTPPPVTGWNAEAAEQERPAASDLQAATAAVAPQLTVDDVLATVAELGNLTGVLSTAEPSDRAQLYEALGVTGTYADTRNACWRSLST